MNARANRAESALALLEHAESYHGRRSAPLAPPCVTRWGRMCRALPCRRMTRRGRGVRRKIGRLHDGL
jgi:hypothetical protein